MLGFHFDKTMEEVKQDMEEPEVQLIDVREKEEYEEGHIPGAWLLPLSCLEEQAAATLQPQKKYYVYCRSGQRSRTAVKRIKAMGYSDVYNVGGIIHWPYEVKAGNER